MLARANFGCGSSREHAPWAVADYGFRVLIAPSFADIFYNNCFKNGILPLRFLKLRLTNSSNAPKHSVGYSLTADLPGQTISDASGLTYKFEIDPFRKHVLLEGLDDIGLTLKHEQEITAYEQAHASKRHDVRARGREVLPEPLVYNHHLFAANEVDFILCSDQN